MAQAGQQLRMQPTDVKQRHRRQDRRLQLSRHDGGDGIGRGHRCHCTDEVDIEQGLADCTLRGLHALGATGSTRGEQNQGCVFGLRSRSIKAFVTTRRQRIPGDAAAFAIHNDHLECTASNRTLDAIVAVRIADQPGWRGVLDIAHQLAGQTKAVERHRDRPQQGHGSKGHGPFGAVAHRNGHALTRLQAVLLLQAAGHSVHRCKEAVKRPAVIAIHHELRSTMHAASIDQLWQILESVAIGRKTAAIRQRGLQNFKRSTG